MKEPVHDVALEDPISRMALSNESARTPKLSGQKSKFKQIPQEARQMDELNAKGLFKYSQFNFINIGTIRKLKIPPWLCFGTCQGESLTKQWTSGP